MWYRVNTKTDYNDLMQHLENQGYAWGSGDKPTSLHYFGSYTIYISTKEVTTCGWSNPEGKVLKTIGWSQEEQGSYEVWVCNRKRPSIFKGSQNENNL